MLREEIERLRDRLHKLLEREDASDAEILKLSQELDILINKYYKLFIYKYKDTY